jgi:hypothetical protein
MRQLGRCALIAALVVATTSVGIVRFDSLSETITALTLAGDTAHAIVDQRTVRQQRLNDGALHEVRTSVVQRESWIRTPLGWLLWRVDQIQPGETLVDGRRLP